MPGENVICTGCGASRPEAPGPCVGCGDTRRTFAKHLEATVGISGRLTAHKPPSEANQDEALRITDSHLTVTASATNTTVETSAQGPAPQGEEPAAACAAVFLEHLRARGEAYELSLELPEESGVDLFARSPDGTVLKLQHTRALATQDFWRKLAEGTSTGPQDLDTAAQRLMEAIERKRSRSAPDIVLLLDATIAVSGALQAVVVRFREQYAADAASAGFRAIWVVGPIASLVRQLA